MLLDKKMIPQLLRDKRICKKLSVEQVSAKLKDMGFSVAPKTLYGYEKGVSMPNVPIFIALCDIYKDSEAANFDRLYKLFSELNEVGQSEAFSRLGEIHANKDFLKNPLRIHRQGNVIYCDFKRR